MRIYVQASRLTHSRLTEPLPAEWAAWTDAGHMVCGCISEAVAVMDLFLQICPDTEIVQLETQVIELTDAQARVR